MVDYYYSGLPILFVSVCGTATEPTTTAVRLTSLDGGGEDDDDDDDDAGWYCSSCNNKHAALLCVVVVVVVCWGADGAKQAS